MERAITKLGILRFISKHQCLVCRHTPAVAPYWAEADRSALPDWHSSLTAKAREHQAGVRPPLEAVLQADFKTRVRLAMLIRNSGKTVTDAVQLSMASSIQLFSTLLKAAAITRPIGKRPDRSRTPRACCKHDPISAPKAST